MWLQTMRLMLEFRWNKVAVAKVTVAPRMISSLVHGVVRALCRRACSTILSTGGKVIVIVIGDLNLATLRATCNIQGLDEEQDLASHPAALASSPPQFGSASDWPWAIEPGRSFRKTRGGVGSREPLTRRL